MFASTTLKILEKSLLSHLLGDSKVKGAEYRNWVISEPDDKHPFFYASIELGEDDQISRCVVRKFVFSNIILLIDTIIQSIFQSPSIIQTLAQHLNLISPFTLGPKKKDDWPHGALIMSMLAVRFPVQSPILTLISNI